MNPEDDAFYHTVTRPLYLETLDLTPEARAMQPQYTEHFETLPAPPGRVRERRWWTNSRGALVAGVLEERNAP